MIEHADHIFIHGSKNRSLIHQGPTEISISLQQKDTVQDDQLWYNGPGRWVGSDSCSQLSAAA